MCSGLNPLGSISGFDYRRFYLYIPFLLTVFSAVGSQIILDRLEIYKLKSRIPQIIRYMFVSGLCLIIIWKAIEVKKITMHDRQIGSNYANIFENPFLMYLADYSLFQDAHYRAVTIFREGSPIHPQPAYLWPYGFNTLDGYSGLYTLRFSRFWQAVLSPMMQAYPQCRTGLVLLEGESRVSLNAACDVGGIIDVSSVTDLFDLDLLSLGGARYIVSSGPLASPQLTSIDTSDVDCPPVIPGCTPRYLYENPNAFPFVYTIGQVKIFGSDDEILEEMKIMDLDQLRNVVLVNSKDVQDLSFTGLGESPANVELTDYSSDIISIEFSSAEAKILVINWSFVPSWRGTIDSAEVEIFPTYETFMGVFVPAGEHTIELKYEPIYTLSGFMNMISGK
jgi:hypothetical protein